MTDSTTTAALIPNHCRRCGKKFRYRKKPVKFRKFCQSCNQTPDGSRRCTMCAKAFNNEGTSDSRCLRCNASRSGIYMRTPAGRFSVAKSIAKKRGIVFALTFEKYTTLVAQPCTYCGFPLCETGMGVDRVDSMQGYLPSNVVPSCWECNQTKSTYFTFEEMKIVGAAIAQVKAARVKAGRPLKERDGKTRGWGKPKKYADPA